MKKKIYSSTIRVEVLGAMILVSFFLLLVWIFFSKAKFSASFFKEDSSEGYEILKSKSKYDILDDSLAKLQLLTNTLKNKIERSKTNLSSSEGLTVPGFGVHDYIDSTFKNKGTFMILPYFGLNIKPSFYENGVDYYYENGKSYLRTSKIIKRKGQYAKLIYIYRNVNYRYDFSGNKIIIPLKNRFEVIIAKSLCYLIGIVSFYIILFGFLLLIRFLISISRNKIFEDINIRRLIWMSICCFSTILIPYFISLVIYLLYYKTLSDGTVYTKTFSGYEILLAILGILFFGLYIAFKKGMKIKQENDLTI